MERQRDYQFDNIKAFLIFCVVLGHVLDKFAEFYGWVFLYEVIFSFHMPAFLFVSGYFAHYAPKKFYSKMFPLYAVCQVTQFFLRRFLEFLTMGESEWKRFDFFTPQWTLWYLMALMMFQLMLPIFDTENRRHQVIYLVLTVALGLLIGFTQDTDNFMSMSRVFVFLPFYLWGFYERKNQIVMRFCRQGHLKGKRLLAVLVGALIVLILWVSDSRIVASEMYGKRNYDDFGMFANRFFIYVMAVAWIVILFLLVPRRGLGGCLGRIGRNTLSIYLLHTLCLLCLRDALPDVWVVGTPVFVFLLTAALTFVFSWDGFSRALGRIRVPYQEHGK